MSQFNEPAPRPERVEPIHPVRRWARTLVGHFSLCVCMGAVLCLTLLPGLALVYLFLGSGGLIFLAAAIPALGLAGPVWAATQRVCWDIQFGFPSYLFKTFWREIRKNFRQGFLLGMLTGFLWLLLGLVLFFAATYQVNIPFLVRVVVILAAGLLSAAACYSFYQITRWKLSLRAVIGNSLLLFFAVGLRTIAVAVVWLVFIVALLRYYLVVVPLCLVCGLPALMCMTSQAIFVPRLDALLNAPKDTSES